MLPPTDPLSAWLDDLRDKAEAIAPGERYTAYRYTGEESPLGWAIHRPDPDYGHDIVADEMTGKHAAYFAALDPETVLALVRLAQAIAHYPQGTSWAEYDELVAAEDALLRLAQERVR